MQTDSSEIWYRYEVSHGHLQCRNYRVTKRTPKGVYLLEDYYFSTFAAVHPDGKPRWVSTSARKRHAYPTKEEAWHNFKCRNERALWFRELALNQAKAVKQFIETHPDPPEKDESVPGFYPPSFVGIEDFY